MRKNRFIGQDRCYHLISRLAHRAFFLDDEEKDRAVALMRRVEEFSGVVVLAYAFMSNHFHIFIYVPSAEEIGEGEILRRIRVLYRDASLSQVVATWNRLKTEEQELFKNAWKAEKEECRAGRGAAPFRSKADPRLDIPDKVGIGLGKGSERTAKRILELLVDGPMRPSALREAVGIKSPIHFSRYYLRPLMEKGMIERTDPDSPKSPRQEYKLA